MSKKKIRLEAIDLFCGVGGLTHGLKRSGINVVAGIDIDSSCEYPYSANNKAKFIKADITEITADNIKAAYAKNDSIKILAGCAPCQPFSKYRLGEDTSADKKWKLLYEFARLITDTKPSLVTMENVPELTKHSVFDDFVNQLKELGYFISYKVINCADYGIPQNRKRLVLLGSLFGEISLLPATHSKNSYVNVRSAIGHLKKIKSGDVDSNDLLHRASQLSKINIERIKQSKPGGSWRDWDESLRLKCHLKETGKSYPSVYGRMTWEGLAPTMTTLCYGYGNGRFGHPEQDRAISLREAAIFQSFPENYEFFPQNSTPRMSDIGRLIGNAVPVKLGEIIGISFKNHLEATHADFK
jgi:DNA (cytosine-5)-methyltransferase 1